MASTIGKHIASGRVSASAPAKAPASHAPRGVCFGSENVTMEASASVTESVASIPE